MGNYDIEGAAVGYKWFDKTGAKPLFPFTHDAWRFGDLTIRVVDTARIRSMGYETVTTDAMLVVTRRDVTTRLRGSMICGS